MKIVARLVPVLLIAFHASLQAQTVYKWTDAKGVVHYTAQPPPQTKVEKLELSTERNSIAPDTHINAELQQQIAERAERQRVEREKREAARAEAERRAGLKQWQAQQDALLVEQCQREGKSYCDDAARIRAAEARHQRLQKKRREDEQRQRYLK